MAKAYFSPLAIWLSIAALTAAYPSRMKLCPVDQEWNSDAKYIFQNVHPSSHRVNLCALPTHYANATNLCVYEASIPRTAPVEVWSTSGDGSTDHLFTLRDDGKNRMFEMVSDCADHHRVVSCRYSSKLNIPMPAKSYLLSRDEWEDAEMLGFTVIQDHNSTLRTDASFVFAFETFDRPIHHCPKQYLPVPWHDKIWQLDVSVHVSPHDDDRIDQTLASWRNFDSFIKVVRHLNWLQDAIVMPRQYTWDKKNDYATYDLRIVSPDRIFLRKLSRKVKSWSVEDASPVLLAWNDGTHDVVEYRAQAPPGETAIPTVTTSYAPIPITNTLSTSIPVSVTVTGAPPIITVPAPPPIVTLTQPPIPTTIVEPTPTVTDTLPPVTQTQPPIVVPTTAPPVTVPAPAPTATTVPIPITRTLAPPISTVETTPLPTVTLPAPPQTLTYVPPPITTFLPPPVEPTYTSIPPPDTLTRPAPTVILPPPTVTTGVPPQTTIATLPPPVTVPAPPPVTTVVPPPRTVTVGPEPTNPLPPPPPGPPAPAPTTRNPSPTQPAGRPSRPTRVPCPFDPFCKVDTNKEKKMWIVNWVLFASVLALGLIGVVVGHMYMNRLNTVYERVPIVE